MTSVGGNLFRDKVMILLDLDLNGSDWSALSAIAALKGEVEIRRAQAIPLITAESGLITDGEPTLAGAVGLFQVMNTRPPAAKNIGNAVDMPGGPHVPNAASERCVNCGITWPPSTVACRAANMHGVNFP